MSDYTHEQLTEGVRKAAEAGDNVAANELAAMAAAMPAAQPEPVLELDTESPITQSLLESMGGTLEENAQELSDRYTGMSEANRLGTIDDGMGAVGATRATLSQGIRTGGGLAGDVLSFGWDHLPDYIKDPIKTTAEDVWNFVKEVPGVQQAMAVATEGAQAYDEWAAANPQDAEVAAGTVDIAAVMFPRINPVRPYAVGKANAAVLKDKRGQVATMLRPDPNTGDGRWRETGMGNGRAAVYEPVPAETEMYEIVETVKGINPKRTHRKNAEVVLDDVNASKAELDARIINQGNPEIDLEDVKAELIERTAKLPQQEGLALVGDAEKVANRVLEEAFRILDESDGSALGLLNARRKFDEVVRRVRGDGVYDPTRESGIAAASRIVRGVLNERVKDAVPNANVHDLLNRQHRLIQAHDILDSNAKKEAKNVWGRAIQRLKDTDLLPSTVLALSATGTAAMESVSLGAAVLGAAGIYVGGKMIAGGTRQSKKIIATVVQSLNKAIDKAQGSEVAKLKADRAMLVEYMHDLPTEEQQQSGTSQPTIH